MRAMTRRFMFGCIAGILLAGSASAEEPAGKVASLCKQPPRFDEHTLPPWQGGTNNDVTDRGLLFTVPEIDVLADFHGDLTDPKLVLFFGGNYYFATKDLVLAFEAAHPEFKGRIFWETIPPGRLIEQIEKGGRITVGNMTWTAKADVYFGGLRKVKESIDKGILTGPVVPYVTNNLAIMVAKGNPSHVTGLADLGRPDIRLAMPNPAYEGIGRQIKAALVNAGGETLATMVYETKVKDGSTYLTMIHHRQTPLSIMQGCADAGVTWQSEASFQEQVGNPIEHVTIPDNVNVTAIYAGAEVKGAPHPQAAKEWLEFIHSPEALKIFERYGFKPYNP
ncbi:MAG: substrate-binding domain-containing protein [Xanthobacteraceae bacterium]|nr:substrate-binding domain-containing protein [Xanthobacteraceae bacterium]